MSELHSYDLKPSKQFDNTYSMIIVSTQVQISCGPHLKVCINGSCHMTKMDATPIMVKPKKSRLNVYKDYGWSDIFYGKDKCLHLWIWMGKPILTDFKNATPTLIIVTSLNLNIFWIKNSIVMNFSAWCSSIIVVYPLKISLSSNKFNALKT